MEAWGRTRESTKRTDEGLKLNSARKELSGSGKVTDEMKSYLKDMIEKVENSETKEVFTIQVGDVLKISFPGAPNLDSTQTVRRDGRITMSVVGELTVTGLTPVNLEQELLKLYSNQLVSREVSVLVVSSTYPIFVSGAVGRPGKILADRPMTVLEAIMESGGFDTANANLKAVKVVRQEATGTKTFVFDLQSTLDGKSSEPFFVKRSDIIIVPEKFTWF
jgi:polysaccharide export outer membrane protein